MDKNTLDIVLLSTQVLTLVALIIYVVKTWQIASATRDASQISAQVLKETKEARDLEVAPYVLVFFDMPAGIHIIDLVVKNTGKTIARDIRLSFEPRLFGSREQDFTLLSMIKDGIPSLPPGQEIRTFVDTSISFFSKKADRAMTYEVSVSYRGGLNDTVRTDKQILDLTAHLGTSSITRYRMHDLVEHVQKLSGYSEKIARQLSDLNDHLSDGLHLRTPIIGSAQFSGPTKQWQENARQKLTELKLVWQVGYGGNQEKLLMPYLNTLKNWLALLSDQLIVIGSYAHPEDNPTIQASIMEIVRALSDLVSLSFYLQSDFPSAFDTKGNEIIKLVDDVLKHLEDPEARAGA